METNIELINQQILQFLEPLIALFGERVVRVFGAVLFLILGWLGALILRAIIRRSLSLFDLNGHFQRFTQVTLDIERGIARLFYYFIMVLVLIAFFDILQLKMVSKPLTALAEQVFAYLPRLLAGLFLIVVAWGLAHLAKMGVIQFLQGTQLDDRLAVEAGRKPFSESLGNVAYWLVVLFFLPAILQTFGLEGLLGPVQNMINQLLAMLPNIIAAILIGIVGWLVAKILRDLVTNLLEASGLDLIGRKAGLGEQMPLSRLVGIIVFLFVFIPALIAALNTLKIEAISKPATQMLSAILNAIPNLIAAALILAIAYPIARLVSGLTVNILSGFGFDTLPSKLEIPYSVQQGGVTTPSRLVGRLITIFIMLFAFVEAANRLQLEMVSQLVAYLIQFGGKILLGGTILAIGFWLANLVYRIMCQAIPEGQPTPLASVVRVAIMLIVAAMGLREMGIAADIVNTAFVLTLGAIAAAFVIAFGLGAREAAGKLAMHWVERLVGKR